MEKRLKLVGREPREHKEVPGRVQEALEDARGFWSFRERRTFNFIHLFSGKEDVLGNAIREECMKANLKVKIHSVDRERVQGADMLSDEPYGQILKDAQDDFFDGGHSGYPCGSFSRARYNEKGEGPPPVRSLQHVYGLPSNNSHRQAEADGTVMCVRSINIISEILQSQRRRGVPEAGTVENPQGSETGFEGPSWALPGMIRFTEVFALMEANFNTCAYQRDCRRKWFKPGRFRGRLNQLESMSRPCTCTSSFRHEALVGKKLTSEAAQYPLELCRIYAALIVKAWKGMNADIELSNGIYPQVDVDIDTCDPPALGPQLDHRNYQSVYEDLEGSIAEIDRLVSKGFAVEMSKQEAEQVFGTGTISKMALLTKVKDSGAIKRRLIVDMLRSGGNSRARVPERIILPRLCDVVGSLQELWACRDEVEAEAIWQNDPEDDCIEIVGADLADAFCHFGICEAERRNCLAPSPREGRVILFKAMLFGFKGAPLIMGRLSGALARMWQALLAGGRGMVQIYMDDPIIFLAGPRDERARNLSMLLYSARAMGLNLAFEKGDRGAHVKWIGVKIQLEVQRRTVELAIPKKVIEEIHSEVDSWWGMTSLRKLRAVTGRMSWLEGVLPRLRWVVSIMYAVLADAEEDKRSGAETDRAESRQDKRDKADLVAIKRLRLPMAVINYMAENPEHWLFRSIALKPERPSMGIITDASPQGIGAILVAVNEHGGTLEPQEALEFVWTSRRPSSWVSRWGRAHRRRS